MDAVIVKTETVKRVKEILQEQGYDTSEMDKEQRDYLLTVIYATIKTKEEEYQEIDGGDIKISFEQLDNQIDASA